jgi:hypothetical protein
VEGAAHDVVWQCSAGWLLYLLGVLHPFSGTFSLTEIALTIVIGGAALVGIREELRFSSARVAAARAWATSSTVLCLQLVAFRLSLLPQIAHR